MSKLKNYVDVVIFEIVYIASDLVLKNIFKPVMLNLASFLIYAFTKLFDNL